MTETLKLLRHRNKKNFELFLLFNLLKSAYAPKPEHCKFFIALTSKQYFERFLIYFAKNTTTKSSTLRVAYLPQFLSLSLQYLICTPGQENYSNQAKYGKHTFEQLTRIQEEGLMIDGHWHQVDLVFCSDWKAAACIEGACFNWSYSQFSHFIYPTK